MKIGILGSGAFALALCSMLEENNEVILWTKFQEEKEMLIKDRSNKKIFSDYKIKDNVLVTNDIVECITNKDLIIVAIPSIYVTDTFKLIKDYINNDNILITCKGLTDENILVSDAVKKYLNTNNYAVLSGPNFAVDIVKKYPTAFTIASSNEEIRKIVDNSFNCDYIKEEYVSDVESIEYLGILKNIYAIISGILEGLDVPYSTKAFYLTDALHDIKNILNSLNCSSDVLTYAGFGDFFLTATSANSRNYSYGLLLGNNTDTKEYLNSNTVEGYSSLNKMKVILDSKSIKSKYIDTLYKIVNENIDSNIILDILV